MALSIFLQQMGTKLGRDLLWNLLSFVVLGICGVLINLVIARAYGASELGVFNQSLTVYIFVSQFCAFGIHLSVLSHLPRHADDVAARGEIAFAALAATLSLSTAITLLGLAAVPYVGGWFGSDNVGVAYRDILPGIWLFAVNKTLLNTLNAMRAMHAFATMQAARPALMLLGVSLLAAQGMDGNRLCLAVSAAEAIIFLGLMACVAVICGFRANAAAAAWVRTHFAFGARSFLSGSLGELNSRLDVLVLGIFASDRIVGIYSFASMISEGLAQLAAVVKNSINPLISQYYFAQRRDDLSVLLRASIRRFYGVMVLVAAAGAAAFPVVTWLVGGHGEFGESWSVFAIQALFLAAVGGYLPLDQLFNQCGLATLQTAIKFFSFLATLALCLAAAPFASAHLMAVAMGVSALFALMLVKLGARRWLDMRI